MPEYDFDMEEEDVYDDPDAYVDEGDSILELEDLQESLQEGRGGPREPTFMNQILLCKFVPCRACLSHVHLVALFDLQSVHQTRGGGAASGRPQLRAAAIEALQSFRVLNSSAESPEDDEDEDYEDDENDYTGQFEGDWHQQWFPPHKEPQKPGVDLLMGGEFGCVSPKIRSKENKKNVSRLMLNQSSRPRGAMYRENITSVCCPLESHAMG